MIAEPDPETARAALDRLVDGQLLEPTAGGRYRLHDLVRLVAAERATDEDSPADRNQALHRALTFYACAVRDAEAELRSYHSWPFPHPPEPEGMSLPRFDGPTGPANGWTMSCRA